MYQRIALVFSIVCIYWFMAKRRYEYVDDPDAPPVRAVNVSTLALANQLLYESKLRERTLRRLAMSVICKKGHIVTAIGGWCLFPTDQQLAKGHWPADPGLVPILSELFAHQRVVDIGAGLGQYGKVLRGLKSYHAYDGALNVEEFTRGDVEWLDLTTPFTLEEPADWILSLEVGEHIPREFAVVFLDSIAKNALYGVVLSWAVPFQSGDGHVNNQPNEYVIEEMRMRGYVQNPHVQERMRRSATYSWFRNTAMVFDRMI